MCTPLAGCGGAGSGERHPRRARALGDPRCPGELGCTHAELDAAIGEHLDHAAKLVDFRRPLLLLHTADDGLVDVLHARRNHDAAGSAAKKLVVFPDGDHNTIAWLNHDAYWRELRAFCDALR